MPTRLSRAFFRDQGSRGARLQAAAMTPAERTARATKASRAAATARTAAAKIRRATAKKIAR
jgi:hypothetical protein